MNITEDEIFSETEAIAKNGFERNLAFIIGINNYSNGISPLKTAVNDAKKLVEVLREKYKYQVWVCLDEVATLTNLNQLLEKTLPEQVSENDRLLFYFAGHGVALNGDDGPAGYLIPQDAKGGDTNSYLPMTKLHDALSKLPCRHFLGILDCCFAGAFRWSSTRDLLTSPEVIHKERYDRFITDAAWQIITSSASDQKALDNFNLDTQRGQVGNHSPFAAALLEALEGAADAYPPAKNGKPAGDGVITATELYLHLRDRVEISTEKYRMRQTPGIWCLNKHDKGEYIFLSPGHELNLPPAPPLDESQNPYRGLKSFDEEHSELFFGRTELVEKLQAFVKTHPLTLVLGASGSGKSSVVKAGLIPNLKKETKETSNKWCILSPIRPGETPFRALNNALVNAQLPKVELQNQQKALTESIAVWAKNNPNSKLLIFIDQSEEIITLCDSENERKEFFQQILTAINAHRDKLRVVLSLRSDFEPQIRDAGLKFVPTVLQLGNTALKNRWQSGRFIVPIMTRSQLREAIEKPAEERVMYFQPHELVEQLIDEVDNMPGGLPLLSFALSELFLKYLKRQRYAQHEGKNIDRALTQEDYQELGGVIQSLTQRADEEYQALVQENPAYEQVIRHVMLRMVAIGGGELVRRRVPLSELEYPPEKNILVKQVIERFSAARLVVEGQDAEGNPYVEPAHDALVRGWKKLFAWKQQEEESLILQRRLTPAAQEWQSVKSRQQPSGFQVKAKPAIDWLDRKLNVVENFFNKINPRIDAHFLRLWYGTPDGQEGSREKPAQHLWNGNPYLDVLNETLNSNENWLNQVEAEFVRESIVRKQQNHNWRWRIAIAVMLGLLGLTGSALFGQGQALIGQIRASQQASEANFVSNQQLDALINSLRAAKTLKEWPWYLSWFKPENQLENAVKKTLQNAVYTVRELNRLQHSPQAANVSVRFSPDGRRLATAGDDNTIALWDVHGQQLKTWPIEEGWSFDFSPSDPLLATAGGRGIVRLWNFEGQKLDNWDTGIGWIRSISFSKDGRLLATAGEKGTVIWNLQDKSSVKLEGQNGVWSVNFSPDGQLVATAGLDRTVRLWNLKGEPVKKWEGYKNSLRSVDFSPDGQFVAIGGDWDSARLWKWQEKSYVYIDLKQTGVSSISFRPPDGQYLATASFNDGAVRLLDWGGNEKKILRSSGFLKEVSFSSNGNLLATAGDNGNIALWDLQGQPLVELKANQDKVKSVSFSSNGQTLATTTDDGTVRWWNLKGEPIEDRREDAPLTNDSCNLKERGLQVRKGKEGTIAADKAFVYDWQNEPLAETSKGHPGYIYSIDCTIDGKLLATTGADGRVRLWDLQHLPLKKQNPQFLTLKQEWPGKQGEITFVQFSRDGKLLATGGAKSVHLWNIDGEHLATWETDQGRIKSISFSPDRKLLATVGDRGNPKLLPIESLDELMKRGCNWVRDYLNHSPDVEESDSEALLLSADRHLCDNVPKVVAKDKSF